MATLHGTADAAHPRLPGLAAPGGLQPETGRVGPGLSGAVAIRPIGPRTRQVARVRGSHGNIRRRRLDNHRLQDRLGLYAVVGPRLGHHGAQRQATLLGR